HADVGKLVEIVDGPALNRWREGFGHRHDSYPGGRADAFARLSTGHCTCPQASSRCLTSARRYRQRVTGDTVPGTVTSRRLGRHDDLAVRPLRHARGSALTGTPAARTAAVGGDVVDRSRAGRARRVLDPGGRRGAGPGAGCTRRGVGPVDGDRADRTVRG